MERKRHYFPKENWIVSRGAWIDADTEIQQQPSKNNNNNNKHNKTKQNKTQAQQIFTVEKDKENILHKGISS